MSMKIRSMACVMAGCLLLGCGEGSETSSTDVAGSETQSQTPAETAEAGNGTSTADPSVSGENAERELDGGHVDRRGTG